MILVTSSKQLAHFRLSDLGPMSMTSCTICSPLTSYIQHAVADPSARFQKFGFTDARRLCTDPAGVSTTGLLKGSPQDIIVVGSVARLEQRFQLARFVKASRQRKHGGHHSLCQVFLQGKLVSTGIARLHLRVLPQIPQRVQVLHGEDVAGADGGFGVNERDILSVLGLYRHGQLVHGVDDRAHPADCHLSVIPLTSTNRCL